MGYEAVMQTDILAMLKLFQPRVPDSETHGWVTALIADSTTWPRAHELFDRIRARNLRAVSAKDRIRESQHCFEEVCLKSVYNESFPDDPFDACSPYWVVKCALAFARCVGIPVAEVAELVAPAA